jgi:hypothetical protein
LGHIWEAAQLAVEAACYGSGAKPSLGAWFHTSHVTRRSVVGPSRLARLLPNFLDQHEELSALVASSLRMMVAQPN